MSYRLGDRTTIKEDEARSYEEIVPGPDARPSEASGNAFSANTRLRCVGRRDGAVILHAWMSPEIAEQERHRQRMLDRHEKAMGAEVTRPRGPFPAMRLGDMDGTQEPESQGGRVDHRGPMGPRGSTALGGTSAPGEGVTALPFQRGGGGD